MQPSSAVLVCFVFSFSGAMDTSAGRRWRSLSAAVPFFFLFCLSASDSGEAPHQLAAAVHLFSACDHDR